jgi:hypothetical protein
VSHSRAESICRLEAIFVIGRSEVQDTRGAHFQ